MRRTGNPAASPWEKARGQAVEEEVCRRPSEAGVHRLEPLGGLQEGGRSVATPARRECELRPHKVDTRLVELAERSRFGHGDGLSIMISSPHQVDVEEKARPGTPRYAELNSAKRPPTRSSSLQVGITRCSE